MSDISFDDDGTERSPAKIVTILLGVPLLLSIAGVKWRSDRYIDSLLPEQDPTWFKNTPGQFPDAYPGQTKPSFPDVVQYYKASDPSVKIRNWDEAAAYCEGLNLGAKLFCPQNHFESQVVFTNALYGMYGEFIDSDRTIKCTTKEYARLKTYIGVKVNYTNNAWYDNQQYVSRDPPNDALYCATPHDGVTWNFHDGIENNPWRILPNKGQCVVLGDYWYMRWYKDSKDCTAAARAICMSRDISHHNDTAEPLINDLIFKVMEKGKYIIDDRCKGGFMGIKSFLYAGTLLSMFGTFVISMLCLFVCFPRCCCPKFKLI